MRIDRSIINSIGFGCLQLEGKEDTDAINIIVKAYELGVRHFDTAAAYGSDRHNEKLLAKAIIKIANLYGPNHGVFFSTKCGINFATMFTETRGYEANPTQIRKSVEESLRIFNVAKLPLVYLHRIDPEATDGDVDRANA